MTLGATLQAFEAPDRNGTLADITLGHDTAAAYVTQPNFWGQTVGRYANRIAGGRFTLDGKTYQLPLNDKTNSLHGGTTGFDKAVWRIVSVTPSGPRASVTMALTSPAGDQGYPGKLDVEVTYALDDAGALTIDFTAKTDAPTIVNLTNHALFDLAGEGSAGGIYAQRMTIPAARYTPVNAALIPTGELKPVAGSVFDFTRPRAIGQSIRDGRDPQIVIGRGYDHNFVLDAGRTAQPKLAARVEDPVSGRVLEVLSTEPACNSIRATSSTGRSWGSRATSIAWAMASRWSRRPSGHAQPARVRIGARRSGQAVPPSDDLSRLRGALTGAFMTTDTPKRPSALRSRAWFDNPDNIDMTALYLERYLNFGLSLDELRSGKPIIGIAQTGSDLSPCNRHHLVLAERVREGVREAGGIVLEFPSIRSRKPASARPRGWTATFAYLGLVETLYGYPLDGVVLTIGCDKTTPAMLMGAATVNIPAIALSVGRC